MKSASGSNDRTVKDCLYSTASLALGRGHICWGGHSQDPDLEGEAEHVRDVEERGVLTAPDGGIHDRVLVLNWHRPARKGHHLACMQVRHIPVLKGA